MENKRKEQRQRLNDLIEGVELPTIVVVAVGDQIALDLSDENSQGRVAEEVRLVRSALLYAGHVELVSPAVLRLQKLVKLAHSGSDGLVKVLEAHQASPGQDAFGLDQEKLESTLQMAREMAAFRKRYTRAEIRRSAGLRAAKELHDQVLGPSGDSLASQMREQYDNFWRNYGGNDIEEAIEHGALTFRDAGVFRDEVAADLDTDRLSELLTELLEDPGSHLLLDDHIRQLASNLADSGAIMLNDYAISNSRRAGVGSRLLEHLPVFPNASMASVLEARSELADLRVRYFRGIKGVREKIQASPLDTNFLPEIDEYWRDEVHPVVSEMAKVASQTRAAAVWDVTKESAGRFLDAPTIKEGVGVISMGLAGAALVDLLTGGLAVLASKYGLSAQEVMKARRIKRAEQEASEWQYLIQLSKQL